MTWLENHDIVLLREILHIQLWSQRHGSVERGQLWDKIAVVLNYLEDMNFKVTTRLVRDRYTLLVKKYKNKWSDILITFFSATEKKPSRNRSRFNRRILNSLLTLSKLPQMTIFLVC